MLLFCIAQPAYADQSINALKTIITKCFKAPIESCEERVVGESPVRDLFFLLIKLSHTQKNTMALYKKSFGAREVMRFQKIMKFTLTNPNLSGYRVKYINEHKHLYIAKNGGELMLVKLSGIWKIDFEQSKAVFWGDIPDERSIRLWRMMLGFYHQLKLELEQQQSLKAIEKTTNLALISIFYRDIPSGELDLKRNFDDFLLANNTTAETVQNYYLNIADKL